MRTIKNCLVLVTIMLLTTVISSCSSKEELKEYSYTYNITITDGGSLTEQEVNVLNQAFVQEAKANEITSADESRVISSFADFCILMEKTLETEFNSVDFQITKAVVCKATLLNEDLKTTIKTYNFTIEPVAAE